MGVYHFMGLGKSIGTVTKAVDYINRAVDLSENDPTLQKFFGSSGGITHTDVKGAIEAVVIFTSKEIINKDPKSDFSKAFKYQGCDNPGYVRDELAKNLKKVWKRYDKDYGRKIFWCAVDIDNYNDCFEKLIKAVYRFSPINKQGKEIWGNLTGGSNLITISLLNASWLTAKILHLYQLSQATGKQNEIFLPPNCSIKPDNDGIYNTVPFLKVSYNFESYLDILDEIEKYNKQKNAFITNSELLSRLRKNKLFENISPEAFIDNYLLKLYGLGFTQFDKTKGTMITENGASAYENFYNLTNLIETDPKKLNYDWMEEENLD